MAAALMGMGRVSLPGLSLFQSKKTESLPKHTWISAIKTSLTTEQAKNWLKLGNVTSFWVGRTMYPVPPRALLEFGKDMGQFKNILSSWDLCNKTPELLTAAGRMLTERSVQAGYGAIVKFSNWFTSFSDGLSWVGRYYTVLNKLPGVATVHAAATFTYAADGMVEQCGKMVQAQTEEQKVLALLKLTMNISYVALGTLTFSAQMAWMVLNVPLVVLCLTSGTIFGLASYFYEKMYDPLNAYDSVNWGQVKKNMSVA